MTWPIFKNSTDVIISSDFLFVNINFYWFRFQAGAGILAIFPMFESTREFQPLGALDRGRAELMDALSSALKVEIYLL